VNIDATTFALEVINFLVLVWLLKRLLYKPVLDVIEGRRAQEQRQVDEARALREEATALKAQYEQRLAHAAEDRERALAQLDSEIAAERTKRLAAVEAEAQADLERRRSLQARELEQRDAERERRAVGLGARIASRLLDRLAGPALEDGLVELALQDLSSLPAEQREALRAGLQEAEVAPQVASALALDAPRRQAITQALGALAGHPVTPAFVEDASLKAGLRVQAGSWVMMANLRDELAFFGGPTEHAG
jgi:F-type H+-transporting ATPase subunit b